MLSGASVTGFTSQWDVPYTPALDYWTETNTDAYFPRPGWQNGGNRVTSDRYLQSAAYGRLKNLTVGYTIPKNLTTKWGHFSFEIICDRRKPTHYHSSERCLRSRNIGRNDIPD